MTEREASFVFSPESKRPKDEKYVTAWDLINDAKCDTVAKAHAKCWLTYRAFYGEVEFEDWTDKVQPVETPLNPRWSIALLAAEVYVRIRHGGDTSQVLPLAERLNHFGTPQVLREYPGSLQSFIRVKALEAYWLYFHRAESPTFDAAYAITSAFTVWQNTMAVFDWRRHPFRWAEMPDDYPPLMTMAHLAAKLDMGMYPIPEQTFSGLGRIKKRESGKPWFLCMELIRQETGAII